MGIGTLALLTMVLAAGVETGWVQVDGEPTYELRIDQRLFVPLADGQHAVVAVVDRIDHKRISRFQIRGDQVPESWLKLDSESLGWRTNSDGRVDYLVQLKPTQLELLKSGTSIVGEFPKLEGLTRIYVFVGTRSLPRESQANLPQQDSK